MTILFDDGRSPWSTQMDQALPDNQISVMSRKEVAERRTAREAEIDRLGTQLAVACGRHNKNRLVTELLSLLGFIHNTPTARADWENR